MTSLREIYSYNGPDKWLVRCDEIGNYISPLHRLTRGKGYYSPWRVRLTKAKEMKK